MSGAGDGGDFPHTSHTPWPRFATRKLSFRCSFGLAANHMKEVKIHLKNWQEISLCSYFLK